MTHDPVCSMEVDEMEAMNEGLTSEQSGKMYYFCSDDCKEQFEQEPMKYINKPGANYESEGDIAEDYGA